MTYTANTRVLTVDPVHPDPSVINEAAAVLRAGGLVAFPTETVYGLGAHALDAAAVRRVFAAKGRPSADPLIVHLSAAGQVAQVAVDLPPAAGELMQRFWPGPLTLVLRRHPRIPPEVAAGRDTVAVRVPSHPVALALIAAAGVPVVAPSANLFSRPSPTTAQHVLEDLRGRVDVVLDAGPSAIGIESTVVDLTADPPALLRPGGVPAEELAARLPGLSYTPRYLAAEGTGEAGAPSPGMLLKHYSPRARLTLYAGPRDAALAHMRTDALRLEGEGRRVGVMAADEDTHAFAGTLARVVSLGPRADAAQTAVRLFAAMRALDAGGADAILTRAPERKGLGLAIWDRLVRAAEGRVVEAG
jgi:L-threonylcarbamoyladenylate synthase